MTYDLVVWDFDGTVADSLQTGLEIYNSMAARYGCQPVDDPDAVRHMRAQEFMRAHKISWLKLPQLTRAFLAAQKERMESITLVDGITTVLEQLCDAGVRNTIVSSNNEENIRTCLRANKAESYFESVIGVSALFGKSRAVRRLLRDKKVPATRALYVGDEARDVETARQAGLPIAAVSWGLHPETTLSDAEPHFLVHTPAQILDLVGV